jgi:acid phosphatase type 7
MKTKYRTRGSPLPGDVPSPRLREQLFTIRFFCAVVLLILLTASVVPVEAAANVYEIDEAPGMQSASTLTFTAEADARVQEANRSTNYGTATTLQVNGLNNPDIESYIRFSVSGITGTIQSARLRVYVTTNGSANGPAVYGAGNAWTETDITWNSRPARTTSALDNKSSIRTSTWVEYNVSALVTANGTYTLVLVADSSDGSTFSSREGSRPPELIVTLNAVATDTATFTATGTPTATQPTATATIPSPTGTATNTDTPTDTHTPPPSTASQTSTAIPPASQTFTLTPSPTNLPGPGSTLTFITVADARVAQLNPTTNYGATTNLQADGNTGEIQISYIRFTVNGAAGSIQSVKLRVFCTTNGTTNGPAAYLANNNWVESGTGGITWNNRPALISGAADNKTNFGANSWVEYDVTSLVVADGTYTLALVADSADGVVFSSREGSNPPQLVVNLQTTAPTATDTSTPITPPTASSTPTATEAGSVVLVGAGDISNCNRNQDELTAQLLDTIPGTVFTTGDNAYVDGTYTEYLNCYEPTWGRHKSRTKPSPGNHDYLTSGAAGYFQYFNNVPSYYAYDLGAWRIYSLNSEINVSISSPQVAWLSNDLAANPRQCVLAYWHKPRWSSGSNHGDNMNMQAIWQMLYDAGADLVVNGHEHHYERFAEMNASGAVVSQGLREIVVGTGGAALYPFGPPKSASQVRNNTAYGVLKLTLRPNGYDWQFVPIVGSTFTDSGSDDCR